MSDLPFDRVVVEEPDSAVRDLTAAEFLAMPLYQRIGLVLAARVSFFHAGAPVETTVALAALRVASMAKR